MSSIRVNNVKYRLHPVYDLFGADKKGNMISIITKRQPESNSSGSRIKIRSQNSRHFMYDKLVFIWECHNGEKPKDKTVLHVSDTDSDDELDNLRLVNVSERNDIIATRWRNAAWECPDCGFQTTNNARRHHFRACKYSKNPYTKKDTERLLETRNKWRNKMFDCPTCGKQYKNSYKYLHKILCERKLQKMED